MKTRVLLFLFAAFSLFISSASAQIPAALDGLDLTLSTTNPVPGQKVTITARSYDIDINSARVNWVVNGTSIQNGIGKTSLEVIAPVLGKKISLTVTAVTLDGITVQGSLIIGSGYVDMITETDGYVPPFFKGKISPVYQNAVKIIAVPHLANSNGVEYDPKTLVYQWKRNDKALEGQSGYGKQAITLVGDIIPRPYDITVYVSPRDGSAQAEGIIRMNANSASINFYIDDSLYGPLFNQAITSKIHIGSQKETKVLAVPFGFNTTSDTKDNLSWSWLINGNRRNDLASNESIVVRAPENSSGTSNIQLEITNTAKILQGAKNIFPIEFNTRASETQSTSVTF